MGDTLHPVDTGLIPIYDRTRKAKLGHALETAVVQELSTRGAEIAYVNTPCGYEVDFLARHADGREELIQVCANIDDPVTLARETRALQDAATEYPRASQLLLILDKPAAIQLPKGIVAAAARDWLFQQPD